ncbi:MAG: hypothetical protein JO005_01925 [Gammaproteobacteria bacterium]|nr:hypothetical protein [Gammaproteobacteria bacterium]
MSAQPGLAQQEPAARSGGARFLRHLILNVVALAGAGGLFLLHEHWSVAGDHAHATLALIGAAVLAFMPLRSILGIVFRIEGKAMHLLHGLGGLALAGVAGSGLVSGTPLATHAALAPFAIMGAAQALMHPNQPRNAQQAQAMRRFAESLPEVEQFTRGNLSSPANAARAVTVLRDLIGKAQALGYTELDADPGFQSALRRSTTRFGLSLALDQMQKAVTRLAANPAAAAAVPDLQARLEEARRISQHGAGARSRQGTKTADPTSG